MHNCPAVYYEQILNSVYLSDSGMKKTMMSVTFYAGMAQDRGAQ